VVEEITIRVAEAAGTRLCVASDDGEKVFARIAEALGEGRRVSLSFENVSSLTSAFLNTAVGQLYGKFKEEQIRANLSATRIASEDLALLKRVVDTAKVYFSDPERFSRLRKEAMGEDDEP
jgi:hypothetical protein